MIFLFMSYFKVFNFFISPIHGFSLQQLYGNNVNPKITRLTPIQGTLYLLETLTVYTYAVLLSNGIVNEEKKDIKS